MLNRAPSTAAIKIHKTIKVVIVGDGAVGKTALLIYYTTKSFPHEYVPTVFDNFSCIEMFEQKPVSIVLWDTAGQEDYDKLRPLSYPQTDVFLVCYSVASRDSFINVQNKWIKEISPINAPFIIIATKADLRNDKKTIAEIGGAENFISQQEGAALAQEIGAGAFMECSALSGSGISDIFQETIRQSFARALKAKQPGKSKDSASKDDKEKDKKKEKEKEKEKERLAKEKAKKELEQKEKEAQVKKDPVKQKGRSNTHPEDMSKLVASASMSSVPAVPSLTTSAPATTTTTATTAATASPPLLTAKPANPPSPVGARRFLSFFKRGKN